ncbi:Fic family protein [Sphingomonas abietis]|uniref:Fic family protein n=1 Tax=Sphingomonas abietis TaxID=3012344 RepID=A0ABY7NNS3_9SPHN|nr:Fic family protein [Sphingomonas abietis]WBO22288.1 Fic family protein [Sphingomonas abietis]
MFVFELAGESEAHPAYQALAIGNLNRQYDFLRSLVQTSLLLKRDLLSLETIKALNYHAISCLHAHAGELRPCAVHVGTYMPPEHFRVPALMQILIEDVNRRWQDADPVYLAAWVLWRLNWVHPFINGNGRTARVVCYYILCLRFGAWLPGTVILPELIRRDRADYVAALQAADASLKFGSLDLAQLHGLLAKLLAEQLGTTMAASAAPPPPPPPTPALPPPPPPPIP